MKKALATLLLSLAASTAFAQGAPPAAMEEPKVVFKRTTTITFSDVTIEGTTVKPPGEFVQVRPKARFPNMIKVRANFHQEMINDARAL